MKPRHCRQSSRNFTIIRRVGPRLETLEERCTPSVVTWDGEGGDGLWDNPLNWSNDALPGGDDSVHIGEDSPVVNNLASTGVAMLSSASPITFNGDLALGGGSFDAGAVFNGDVSVAVGTTLACYYGQFAFNGVSVSGVLAANAAATIVINGDVTFDDFQVDEQSSVKINGTLTITGAMDLNGSLVQGSGVLVIEGMLNVHGGVQTTFNGCTVQINGALDWTGSDLVTNGASFKNNGAFSATAWAGNWSASGGSLTNDGIFTSDSGADRILSIPVFSSGAIDVSSGELWLGQGGQLGGVASAAAGSVLNLGAGIFTLQGGFDFSGAGIFQIGANTTAGGNATFTNLDVTLGPSETLTAGC